MKRIIERTVFSGKATFLLGVALGFILGCLSVMLGSLVGIFFLL